MTKQEEYEQKLLVQAYNDFASHEITRETETSWTLRGNDTMHLWAQIVVLEGNSVLVFGDVETVLFQWWDTSIEPERILRTVSRSNLQYLASKAAVGMGSDFEAYTVDRGVLIEDLQDALREEIEEGEYGDDVCVDMYRRLIRDLQAGDIAAEDVDAEIYEETEDSEMLGSYGRVPDQKMFYARAAVQRLAVLKGWVEESSLTLLSICCHK